VFIDLLHDLVSELSVPRTITYVQLLTLKWERNLGLSQFGIS